MKALELRQDTWGRPWIVAAFYLAATIVMTWPLVTVADRQVAGDLGDSLFNSWVLNWTSGQVLQALHGNLAALRDYWQGNIFYPAPSTLAYSEHLTPQMLQILPVMAVTGNVILCYNLLLLSTYVLSGLGMYLLVRELTGQPVAAVFAGLAFAFAPFRISQYGHLEVLSSQWMPFTLYGFRRFFVTGRLHALVGGTAALVAQALSCGYYLAYFTPFAVAYCLYELVMRNKLADLRTWRALIGAGAAALLLTGCFLWPYLHVRHVANIGVRGRLEIEQFSADTHAFATISGDSRLWGSRIRAMPEIEGAGFPGFTILAFAAAACGIGLARALARERRAIVQPAWSRYAIDIVAASMLTVLLALLGHTLVTGEGEISTATFMLHKPSTVRLLGEIAVVASAWLVVSPLARRIGRGVPESTLGFAACAAITAAWLSLGPEMHANGNPIGPGLYDIFYRWVPGFDGLRVVSLYFMLVAFFLAILAGFGAAALVEGGHGAPRLAVVIGMFAIIAESWSVPTVVNGVFGPRGYALPPADVAPKPPLIGAYEIVRYLPSDTVLLEFPFGQVAYEIRYTYYAGFHRKPIVNGYSGYFPPKYVELLDRLSRNPASDDAWKAVVASRATHVIVHEDAFLDNEGLEISESLRRHGAHEVVVMGRDRLFQLR